MANFDGTTGDDTLFSTIGVADTLNGDAGNDQLFGYDLNDALNGGADADVLYGGTGDDTLDGGTGDDTLDGGTGIDSMSGGDGNDTYYVDETTEAALEAADEGTNDTVYASVTYTLSDNVENLTLTGTGSINGTGNALANLILGNESGSTSGGQNVLSGLGGDDTLFGFNASDTLDGGTGNDVMYGGTGSDTYVVDSADDQVIETSGVGSDTVQASINYTLTDPLTTNFVENITLTGTDHLTATGNSLENTLRGNSGDNVLTGGAGNDTLRGEGGNDTLDGGTGSDSMTGGTGDDTYYVDTTEVLDENNVIVVVLDEVTEGYNQGTDTVVTSIEDYRLSTYFENLVLAAGVLNGTGNNGNNVLTGNDGDNYLFGDQNLDTLVGGAGNDTLNGGDEADLMQGGGGDDVYLVDDAGDVADETTPDAAGTDLVQSTVTHTMGTGIENLTIITDNNVNGTGNGLANVMTGGTGNNALNGADGEDTLNGGDGADTLTGGAGTDVFAGGTGSDTYVLDSSDEIITEAFNEGIDTVQIAANYTLSDNLENLTLGGTGDFIGTGNAVANVLTGNSGNNQLSGGDGADRLIGGLGADLLDGGTGADTMTGGAGDDSYVVVDSGDVVSETAALDGTDTVSASITYTLGTNLEHLTLTGALSIDGTGNSSANILTGNSGDNILLGGGGADTITGGDGNDTLNGESGNDQLRGGIGNDTYVTDTVNDVLVEAEDEGTDTVVSAVTRTLQANFENLTLASDLGLSGTGNTLANVLTGNGGSNSLSGLEGDDTILGGAGADTLNGGTGNDSMVGGIGNDTYYIDVAGDIAVEAADGGIDTVITMLASTLDDNVENLVFTGAAALNGIGNATANRMTGNTAANTLSGLAGNDTLSGGAGNDVLAGGTGNDSMVGGAGDDRFYVDSSTDVVNEILAGGTDTVYSTASSFTLSANVEHLVLSGTGDINGIGNGIANRITGNSGDNLLKGGAGIDTLIGGNGADTLNGGSGNDVMSGGDGNDTYVVNSTGDITTEDFGNGTDLVQSYAHWKLGANFEDLTMIGTQSTNGTGNSFDNEITGNIANNRLSGLGGDDSLTGGAGNDVLTGGSGADHFIFVSASSGSDTITDFNTLDGGADEGDVIELVDLLVGTFSYRGTGAFTGGSDDTEARVDLATQRVLIDTDGDGSANIAIRMTGLSAAGDLSASDFLFS